MAENNLTPYYAAQQEYLNSLITEQADDAVLVPMDPAEFERRYAGLPTYTEKSFGAYTEALVEKGLSSAEALSHVATHRAGMRKHLLAQPDGTTAAAYVDPRDQATITSVNHFQAETRAAEVAKGMGAPAARGPVDLATITTDAELVAAVGAENIFTDASFSAYRTQLLEKSFRPTAVEDLVSKGRAGLHEVTVADRRGNQVQRWVKLPAAPAAAE